MDSIDDFGDSDAIDEMSVWVCVCGGGGGKLDFGPSQLQENV